MAGLYDRLTLGPSGESYVAGHLVTNLIALILTDELTGSEASDYINDGMNPVLDAQSMTDLNEMKIQALSFEISPGVLDAGRVALYFHQIESINQAVVDGHDKGETSWRTYLGIP